MTSSARTLRTMGLLSLVTLALGAARELLIARDLRASADADLFFRGLVAVATIRACALAVYRARWIPAASSTSTATLLRAGARSATWIGACGVLSLIPLVGPRPLLAALAAPESAAAIAALAIAAFLAAWSSHLRALAERRGREIRGFGVDWGLALGTIAGIVALPGSAALGPSLGLLGGMVVGTAMVLPRGDADYDDSSTDYEHSSTGAGEPAPRVPAAERGAPDPAIERARTTDDRRPIGLLLDALLYGNLGVVDSLFTHLLAVGSLAVLSYAGLFVNSALMLLTGAVTVVALRLAADPERGPPMGRWAAFGGLTVALGLGVIAALLGWAPIAGWIERVLGWDLARSVQPIVLWSLPYAFLRLANTIGRQRRLVHGDLRAVVAWDAAGLAARSLLLALAIPGLGLLAFPLAAALAEVLQLAAWVRTRAPSGPQRRATP
ncbi:MAG: hypothetical protein R3B09_20935 [Nannocystaceae bacterium]